MSNDFHHFQIRNRSRTVLFHPDRVDELVRAYRATAEALGDASANLDPLLSEASALLGQGSTGRVHRTMETALQVGSDAMTEEQLALERRLEVAQAADARTAYLLSIDPDRRINVELAADALTSGWTYEEAVLHHELAELKRGPRPLTEQQLRHIEDVQHALAALAHPFTAAGVRGDLDSDLLVPRVGRPLRFGYRALTAADRGRALVRRAFEDTADLDQIQNDEFEAYFHDNGKLTLVLPGVIDLSNPDWGPDSETGSLRDLDQAAVSSSFTTGIADNTYAERIAEWVGVMVDAGVIDRGTETMIIGHSFGGDTALDLASDEHFNGELLDVTYALSAGYHSQHQLTRLGESTRAVSVVNIFDVIVAVERNAAVSSRRPVDRMAYEVIESGANAAATFVNSVGSVVNSHLVGTTDRRVPEIPELEIEGERVRPVEPNGLFAEFEGGFSGFGHDQSEYIAYLERVDDPSMVDFLVDLDSAGFTSDAVAVSIDITDPEANG